MTGDYWTGITKEGRLFLEIRGTLNFNKDLSPDNNHYAIMVLGNE
jgi:hypothetical protein